MRDHILGKTHILDKCRSKLVQKYGLWFFQQMQDEEWNQKKKKVIVLKEDIHTDEQLTEFCV